PGAALRAASAGGRDLHRDQPGPGQVGAAAGGPARLGARPAAAGRGERGRAAPDHRTAAGRRPRADPATDGSGNTVISDLPGRLDHFVAGAWSPSADGATFAVADPVSNQGYAQVAAGGAADIDRAARAARCAFTDGPWPGLAARQRARVLNRIADGIERRGARIAELET